MRISDWSSDVCSSDLFESRFWDEIMTFLHRLHIAETYPQQAERLAPEVLSTWLRYAPHAQPVERDWEDWAENAVMLHALDKASGGKVEIIYAGDSCRMSGDHTTMVSPNPNAPDAFMYGIWKPMDSVLFSANFNMVGNHADIVKVVQLYPLSSTFQKASRRFITVDADYNAIETELLKIHATGIREVFIKARFKQSAKVFKLPEDRSEEHTSALQSIMRISYAVYCLQKKNTRHIQK